jgi:hypothetical protein
MAVRSNFKDMLSNCPCFVNAAVLSGPHGKGGVASLGKSRDRSPRCRSLSKGADPSQLLGRSRAQLFSILDYVVNCWKKGLFASTFTY